MSTSLTQRLSEIEERLTCAYQTTYNSTNWKEQGKAELSFLNAAPADIRFLLRALKKCREQRDFYVHCEWDEQPVGREKEKLKLDQQLSAEGEK